MKKAPVVEKVFRDGRTVINMTIAAGRELYQQRKWYARDKQGNICPLCGKFLAKKDATVDHKIPRGHGGGTRDDRQENLRAVHLLCNQEKGSKREVDFDEEDFDIGLPIIP